MLNRKALVRQEGIEPPAHPPHMWNTAPRPFGCLMVARLSGLSPTACQNGYGCRRTRTLHPRTNRRSSLRGNSPRGRSTPRVGLFCWWERQGIEPRYFPWTALTSKEWLISRHTRSRRALPCNARLSELPAFILNGLLEHQNACTVHYTACPLAGVLSLFLSPVAHSRVLYWRKVRESNPRNGFPFAGLANRSNRPLCQPSMMPVFPGCQSVYLDIALIISTSGFLLSCKYFFPSRMAWARSDAAIISPLGASMVAMSMLDTLWIATSEESSLLHRITKPLQSTPPAGFR